MTEQTTENQETQEETKPAEPATPDANAGNDTATGGLIDKANAVAERLEKANRDASEIVARHEQIVAKQMLAGKADAGAVPQQKSKDEQEEEEAKALVDSLGY